MARSRGTDPAQLAQQAQVQQAHEAAQQRHAQQQAQNSQPQHPAQPPYAAQPQLPPAPRKNFFARHKVFTTLLAIVVLVIAVQAVSGGDKPTTTPTPGATSAPGDAPATEEASAETSAAPTPDAPAVPGIGTAVADGKFEFTVTSLEPGVPHIGDATFGVDAQGQFLLVHVTVKNIGAEAQYFDSSSQKLLDGQGRTHSADGTAAIYLPDSNSFLTSINPGNTVEGIVVFDLPVDATPASIELHDSPFSGGVTVTLT